MKLLLVKSLLLLSVGGYAKIPHPTTQGSTTRFPPLMNQEALDLARRDDGAPTSDLQVYHDESDGISRCLTGDSGVCVPGLSGFLQGVLHGLL